MGDSRSVSPPASKTEASEALACPRVAVLIHYALGQAHGDERQLVRAHLKGATCLRCVRWFEQAKTFREDPWIDEDGEERRGTSVSDPTPIPESARWQRQEFGKLEKMLRVLEEG